MLVAVLVAVLENVFEKVLEEMLENLLEKALEKMLGALLEHLLGTVLDDLLDVGSPPELELQLVIRLEILRENTQKQGTKKIWRDKTQATKQSPNQSVPM